MLLPLSLLHLRTGVLAVVGRCVRILPPALCDAVSSEVAVSGAKATEQAEDHHHEAERGLLRFVVRVTVPTEAAANGKDHRGKKDDLSRGDGRLLPQAKDRDSTGHHRRYGTPCKEPELRGTAHVACVVATVPVFLLGNMAKLVLLLLLRLAHLREVLGKHDRRTDRNQGVDEQM